MKWGDQNALCSAVVSVTTFYLQPVALKRKHRGDGLVLGDIKRDSVHPFTKARVLYITSPLPALNALALCPTILHTQNTKENVRKQIPSWSFWLLCRCKAMYVPSNPGALPVANLTGFIGCCIPGLSYSQTEYRLSTNPSTLEGHEPININSVGACGLFYIAGCVACISPLHPSHSFC